MRIGAREVGSGAPCYIIAEIGMAHDGDEAIAHAMIDAAAACGVDAVKFQTHIAAAESTLREPFRKPGLLPDATRYEYWKRTEFTQAQWEALAIHCADAGVEFLSSPFSVEAAELLADLHMRAWKIASGEVDDEPLLAFVEQLRQPVILSTGLSTVDDTARLVRRFRGHSCEVAVLQCTTEYPTSPESIGLNMFRAYRARCGCPVGLSDHSGTVFAGLAAVAACSAELVEVHIVLDEKMPGPDSRASLTPAQLCDLVAGVRFVEAALLSEVSKEELSEEQQALAKTFGRSVVVARDVPAGRMLTRADLAAKKPGGGIDSSRIEALVGRQICVPLAADDLVTDETLLP